VRQPAGYLAFVVLGLVCVVGATIATAVATSDDPGSKLPLYVGVGAVGVFVVLLLAYQWFGIWLAAREDAVPTELLAALAVEPGVEEAARRTRRGMTGGIVGNQILLTAISLAVVVGGGLWVSGVNDAWYPLGDTGPGFPLAFAPVFAILALALFTLPGRLRGAVAAGDELYRPLGLRTVALPRLVILPGIGDSTHLVGGTVVAGRRHGRYVEVVFEGRKTTIAIEGSFAPFTRRQDGAEIKGGPEGIVLERRSGAPNQWLQDLRVAEEVAASAG